MIISYRYFRYLHTHGRAIVRGVVRHQDLRMLVVDRPDQQRTDHVIVTEKQESQYDHEA